MDKERVQCRGKPGQWCVFASVLQGTQRMGKQYAMDADKGVTVRYDYKANGVTEQTVTVDGQVVSTLNLGKLLENLSLSGEIRSCELISGSFREGQGMGDRN